MELILFGYLPSVLEGQMSQASSTIEVFISLGELKISNQLIKFRHGTEMKADAMTSLNVAQHDHRDV